MEDRSSLKLIIEKGPREGETLEYTSGSVITIGRVVRGNTIGIKDAGISSKHICIQFDTELSKWTLIDLDSSNGTILNGQPIKPYVPSGLKDSDCIKIGELTSIIVKLGLESTNLPERNPRRKRKSGAGAGAGPVVESETSELGLGFDADLGGKAVEKPVQKRVLRPRGKKALDSKIEVENLSSKRILRSSRKELKQIPENLNVDATEKTDVSVLVEPKKTRGRKKKSPLELPQDPDLVERKPADIVDPIVGKKTRRGRKKLQVEQPENLQTSVNKSVGIDEGNEAAIDKHSVDPLENVVNSCLEANNEPGQDHVVEKLESTQEDCEGKDSSQVAEDLVKESGPDNHKWLDLEKMTLGDFFDYLEVQLPKEIHEKSEKIISDLAEKARKCHEFKVQINENDKGKLATD